MTPDRIGRAGTSSARATARWAAALNLLSAVPDGFSVSVLRKVVVRGDATATAANVLGSEGLFRLGFVADLVALVLFVASAALLYDLFRPAGRRAALLFLVLIVMGAAFQAMEAVQDLAALALLQGGAAMSSVPPAQAHALALLFLRLHSYDYQLGLFFMGCSSLVIAALVLKSRFVPGIIAPFMMIDGLGFLTFSVTGFLSPALVMHLFPYIPFVTALIGEGVFFLWLLIKSVDADRWLEQAAAR